MVIIDVGAVNTLILIKEIIGKYFNLWSMHGDEKSTELGELIIAFNSFFI